MFSDALKGEALAFAALLLFSINIILVKIGSGRISLHAGYLISVVVNVAFGALLFGVELLLRFIPLHWDWVGFLFFFGAGVFTTYLGRWFNFEAISRLGAARASTFQVSGPLFTVVIAWLWLGERLPLSSIVAMIVATMGLLLVSIVPGALGRVGARFTSGSNESGGAIRGGTRMLLRSSAMLGFGSAAAYAVGNVLRGAGIRQWDEPVLGTLLGAVAGIVLQLIFGVEKAATARGLARLDRRGVVLFAIGGVITICAQMSVVAAMRYIPVAIVALITLCTPIIVFPLSYFVLRNQERVTARTVLGATMTLGAVAFLIMR